jgi:hypothetical protein
MSNRGDYDWDGFFLGFGLTMLFPGWPEAVFGLLVVLAILGNLDKVASVLSVIAYVGIIVAQFAVTRSIKKRNAGWSVRIWTAVLRITAVLSLATIFRLCAGEASNMYLVVWVFIGIFLAMDTVLWNTSKHDSKKGITPQKLICAVTVAVVVGFLLFAELWSIAYYDVTMQKPDADFSYLDFNTYQIDCGFSLYKNKSLQANKNQLIGEYPAGTVATPKYFFRKIRVTLTSKSETGVLAFIGPVQLEDGAAGYIAATANTRYNKTYKWNTTNYGSTDAKKRSVIRSVYLTTLEKASKQEVYRHIYKKIIPYSQKIYEQFDLLGCRSYEARRQAKKEADAEQIHPI